MQKILDLGFMLSAQVKPSNNTWSFSIGSNRHAANVLYAFVFHSGEGDEKLSSVVYIGHTRKSFGNRMCGYQYGHGKGVNSRMHRAISEHLIAGGGVDVFCMPNTSRMSIQDIPVDLAAGLEYGLIQFYAEFNKREGHQLLFNLAGNPARNLEATAAAQDEQVEEDLDYASPTSPPAKPRESSCFPQVLRDPGFWRQRIINVPTSLNSWFGDHDGIVLVKLIAKTGPKEVSAVINRNAQANRMPRLIFTGRDGDIYQEWKHSNHEIGDSISICVTDSDSITIT
jgi:hypothetical protein